MHSPPPPGDQPATVEIPAGGVPYRVHRALNVPLFFDTGPDGRFNPPDVLASTFGTLYLAVEPAGAFLETLGRTRILPTSALAERRLSTVTFHRPLRLFAVHAPVNRFHHGFDLAAEAIATCLAYDRPRRLAGMLHADGLDGLMYPSRHDNSTTTRSVALFGPPGPPADETLATWTTEELPDDLVDEMVHRFHFEVLPHLLLP